VQGEQKIILLHEKMGGFHQNCSNLKFKVKIMGAVLKSANQHNQTCPTSLLLSLISW